MISGKGTSSIDDGKEIQEWRFQA